MEQYKIGTKLRGTGRSSGAQYEGVVESTDQRYGPLIRITKNDDYPGTGSAVGGTAYLYNIERIENVINSNLIGPKPEPVKEPQFVAPFRPDGSNVVDANGTVVLKVREGGHKLGAFALSLPMSKRYDLAKVVAEALTEKFGKPEDSPSPF